MLITTVAPGTSSVAWIIRTTECSVTLQWPVIRPTSASGDACDGCRLSPNSSRWTRAGSMRRRRFRSPRSLTAQAVRTRAVQAACFVMVVCGELQPERWISLDRLREPCPGRSSMRQRRVEAAFAGQTTRTVPEAFLKRPVQQCKGARPKSSLLQGASQAIGMDTMPSRCVRDAESGATLP
ncbi:hypothetical protein OKW42_003292 [Paraburkholderia sp. WC7.3d]